jgi:hypothetical protein
MSATADGTRGVTTSQTPPRVRPWPPWGCLGLLVYALWTLDLRQVPILVDGAGARVAAVARCGSKGECCSHLMREMAVGVREQLLRADGLRDGAWGMCAVMTVVFAVKLVRSRELPWSIRWALLAYALYSTIWALLSQPIY